MKNHLRAMGSYHEDMASMYNDHNTRYSSVEDPKMQKKLFTNFLQKILGFNLPKETSPRDFMIGLIDLHKQYAGTWLKKLSGLTGETMMINGVMGQAACVLEPTLESSQRITEKFKDDFITFFLKLKV